MTIPDSVTYIGGSAFSDCDSLTSVTIPDSVISIGYSAFSNCDSLTNVTIPDSVISIGSGAFSGCRSLTSMTIPASVTHFGTYALPNELISIYFKGNAPSVGFIGLPSGNHRPTLYYIPGTSGWTDNAVYDAVAGTWDACKLEPWEPGIVASGYCGGEGDGTNLTWKLDEEGTLTISGNGSMGKLKQGESPWEQYKESIKKVVMQSGVTSIGAYAFDGCTQINSVEIPDGLETIGDLAFGDCRALTKVSIPGSVKTIGQFAFAKCSGLTSVIIPDSVETLGAYAFYNCDGLTDVELSGKLAEISEGVFNECDRLISIMIPASVKKIGSAAFVECDKLTSIYFRGNAPEVGVNQDRPFSNKEILYHVPGTSGWTDIEEYQDGIWKVYNLDTWNGVHGNTSASLSTKVRKSFCN